MATANPPANLPLILRPPTRLVPTGTITLPAGQTIAFVGSNARQDRIQIVVTNLDPLLNIKWQTLNGATCGTIFALLPWTLETSADIQLFNPNGQDIIIEVAELYPDIGNKHGVPSANVLTAGAPAGGGGGTSSGGTSSGGAGTGNSSGGSQLR